VDNLINRNDRICVVLSPRRSHGIQIVGSLLVALIFPYTHSLSSTIEQNYGSSNTMVTFSKSSLEYFRSTLSHIVNESQYLTKSYQDEIRKWTSGEYNNYTLILITDSFLPKFEDLIIDAKNMIYPQEYEYVHEALVNSLQSETESYRHFKNYLVSGNKTEDDISTELLSLAFQYEQVYSKFLSMHIPDSHQNVTKRISLNFFNYIEILFHRYHRVPYS
jgi:hypothetical protein